MQGKVSVAGARDFFYRHFRILSLAVLFVLIATLSFSIKDKPQNLPFNTYVFNFEGQGEIRNVSTLFDYGGGNFLMGFELGPGSHTLESNVPFTLEGAGHKCAIVGNTTQCTVELSKPAKILANFTGKIIPNGRFRFAFSNRTDFRLKINLDDDYSFKDLPYILPRDVQGTYLPQTNQVVFSNYATGEPDDMVDSVDFDIFVVDGNAERTNATNDWLQQYVMVPLTVSFMLLFISDSIDYVHRYLKEKNGLKKN